MIVCDENMWYYTIIFLLSLTKKKYKNKKIKIKEVKEIKLTIPKSDTRYKTVNCWAVGEADGEFKYIKEY